MRRVSDKPWLKPLQGASRNGASTPKVLGHTSGPLESELQALPD
jgi:hypothetical protein